MNTAVDLRQESQSEIMHTQPVIRPNTGITTLGALAERVAWTSQFNTDKHVEVSKLHFPEGISSIAYGDDLYPLTENAQQQLCSRLGQGIPLPYLRRCDRELQTRQLEYWVRRERRETLFLRLHKDSARAVLTSRYKPVDNEEIIGELFTLGYERQTRVQVRYDHEFLSISIPDGRHTFDVNGNGDKITPGISVMNSEIGKACLTVSCYLFRLVCQNGMIGITASSTRRRHINSNLLDSFASMFSDATNGLGSLKESFRLSQNTIVTDPTSTMARLCKQLLLNEQEQQAAMWGLEREMGSPTTLFHISNGFTAASHYPRLPALSSNRLEIAGAQVLGMVRDN